MPEGENQQGQQQQSTDQGGKSGDQGSNSGQQQGQQQSTGQQSSTDDGKGGKDAILADLAKERDKRQALEKQVADMATASQNQATALAKAFGLKPDGDDDGKSDVESQIQKLTEQFQASQRKATLLEVAAEPGQDDEGNPLPAIPKQYHHLLTATETEALQEQAKSLAALLQASGKADETPGFAASAGQGNNGNGKSPTIPEQIAAAERELVGMKRGTPEYQQQAQRVMGLKSSLLADIHQKH